MTVAHLQLALVLKTAARWFMVMVVLVNFKDLCTVITYY